jgi:hypothetical protein
MKPDWLGDQLEEFHRFIVGGRSPNWRAMIVRILLICVLSQIVFLLFALGLRFCVWITSGF